MQTEPTTRRSGKTKAPAFQFYAADYLTDGTVLEMSYEERGVYVQLLCMAWLEDGIPKDRVKLARRLAITPEKLAEVWPAMKGKWQKRGRNVLVNPRMERERGRISERKAQAKAAAESRWESQNECDRNANATPGSNADGMQTQSTSASASASTSVPKDVSTQRDESPLTRERSPLSFLLADLVETNGSKRPPVTKAWADAERLLIEVDERAHVEAETLIDWCQKDQFWRSNILSMPKFRDKYDQLRLQRDRNGNEEPEYDWRKSSKIV